MVKTSVVLLGLDSLIWSYPSSYLYDFKYVDSPA